DWIINPNLRTAPQTLAGLSSHDKMSHIMVIQEQYPGSLESYKELSQLNARHILGSFEELASQSLTIDGRPAMIVFYRGVGSKGTFPMEFMSAIIPNGNTYTKLTAWCVEPLFHDMQPAFERVASSYRSTGQATAFSAKP